MPLLATLSCVLFVYILYNQCLDFGLVFVADVGATFLSKTLWVYIPKSLEDEGNAIYSRSMFIILILIKKISPAHVLKSCIMTL